MWLGARKILVVHCDLIDLEDPMLPQLMASLPLGRAQKTPCGMKYPPPSTYKHWMKVFRLSPSLKGLTEGMNNQPLRLTNIDFPLAKISIIGSFFSSCSGSFIDRRMGLFEWMAWM